MNISVSSLEKTSSVKVDVCEGLHAEFKASIFWGAKDKCQVEVIARTLAAFMNADGGDLYVGVNDDGYVCGIQSDLDALKQSRLEAIVRGAYLNDSTYDYQKGNQDAFSRKVSAIAQGYLGKNSARYINDVEFLTTADGFLYARIPVSRAACGDVVLFQSEVSKWTELWVREQGAKQKFVDIERDKFIARKARELADAECDKRIKPLYDIVKERFVSSTSGVVVSSGGFQPTATIAVANAQLNVASGIDAITRECPDSKKNVEVSSKDEIMSMIREIIADTKSDGQHESGPGVLFQTYDQTTSTTYVMDKFEGEVDGGEKYEKLILRKSADGLSYLPYEFCDDGSGYVRTSNVDFKVVELELIVERGTPDCLAKSRRGFSFTDLKKGFTGDLRNAIWEQITEDVRCALPNTECEISLGDHPVEFRAHTSDSQSSRALSDPNRYVVSGVRFRKKRLYFCPSKMSREQYERFAVLNMLAMISREK